MLARALAQDTPLMMLDEPTAHLDLPSRIQIMQLLHKMARETNKGILLSTHELDLAMQVADEVWLLQPGGRLDKGVPEDLVLNGTFESVFNKEGILFDKHTGAFHIHGENTKTIGLIGDGIAAFWTRRALQREGFQVVHQRPGTPGMTAPEEHRPDQTITIREEPHPAWILDTPAGSQNFTQLASLLETLRI
jgi:iron complex transport system ATP-binding protein